MVACGMIMHVLEMKFILCLLRMSRLLHRVWESLKMQKNECSEKINIRVANSMYLKLS